MHAEITRVFSIISRRPIFLPMSPHALWTLRATACASRVRSPADRSRPDSDHREVAQAKFMSERIGEPLTGKVV